MFNVYTKKKKKTIIYYYLSNYQNYKDLGELLSYFEDNNTGLGTQVNLAKAIFIQNDYNISKFYKQAITKYVPSELIAVDFKLNGQQAQQTINQYVLRISYKL